MSKNRARAQAHFPTVLLTLISIIQALALELLWSKLLDSAWLWEFGIESMIGWGMVVVALMGILQIWVMYSIMVMGFVWQPYLRDSIVPFILGIQEFMLISLIHESFTTLWLYVLGSVFITANWVAHNSLQRARQDPENADFFDKVEPATLKDFLPAMLIVSVLVLLGMATDLLDYRTVLPLLAVIFAILMMVVQVLSARSMWHSIMELGESTAPDSAE